MKRFRRNCLNGMLALGLTVVTSTAALAGEDADRTISRHTFRSLNAGSSDQLVQTRVDPAQAKVVQAQPLRGSEVRTTSTTASARTSDLLGPVRVAAAPMRSAIAGVTPGTTTIAQVRQAAPLVVGAADDDAQAEFDDRIAVDNNARIARNYASYQPTTVSYEDAQLALAAHRVQNVSYGNTYGTYSPASYGASVTYASYAPRTYYASTYYGTGYYGNRASVYYNSSPRYYTSTYCAPSYSYRAPSYSYCPPAYYRPSYSYYGSYSNYYRPSYGFGYSYNRGCGSSYGFSIRW